MFGNLTLLDCWIDSKFNIGAIFLRFTAREEHYRLTLSKYKNSRDNKKLSLLFKYFHASNAIL